MKCQVCSVEAVAGGVFCPQCGAKLELLDPGGDNASPPAGSGSSGAKTAAESTPTATNAPAPLLEVAYSPEGKLESILFRATATNAAAPLDRRGVSDVPEETLWEGGYSPKAMLGAIIFYAIVGVALLAANEALIAASVVISKHWIVLIGVISVIVIVTVMLSILAEAEMVVSIIFCAIIGLALIVTSVVFSKDWIALIGVISVIVMVMLSILAEAEEMLVYGILCAIISAVLVVASVVFSKVWIASIDVMLVLVIVLAQFVARRLRGQYKLTNQMFYQKEGALTRTADRIKAIDIDDVTWTQRLVERMVNVGTVVIRSRDPDANASTNHYLYGIDNVEQVAQMIEKARLAERLRCGL